MNITKISFSIATLIRVHAQVLVLDKVYYWPSVWRLFQSVIRSATCLIAHLSVRHYYFTGKTIAYDKVKEILYDIRNRGTSVLQIVLLS
jgi:hypothetical protein